MNNDQRQTYYAGVLQGLKIARQLQEKYTGIYAEPLLYAMTALLRRRSEGDDVDGMLDVKLFSDVKNMMTDK